MTRRPELFLALITETSPYKVNPDLHLTYSKKLGKPGVGIENVKYSLYLNFNDKTCKTYLFIFV